MTDKLSARLDRLLTMAQGVYEREDMDGRIERLADLYDLGRQSYALGETQPLDDAGVHVNEVYPRVRTAMAALAAKAPEVFCKPTTSEHETSAALMEVTLNWLTRKMKYPRELRDALFYARLFPYGAVKITMSDGPLSVPRFTALDPRVVRIDPTTDRMRPEEARWEACRHKRSLAALYASGLYKESVLDKVMAEIIQAGDAAESPETVECWIWEHYVYEYVEGREQVLLKTNIDLVEGTRITPDNRRWIREDIFTDAIGLPFKFLSFVPSAKHWFPRSPVELWLDQQREINVYRNNKLAHADRAIRKLWFDKNKVDEKDQWKLETREPMAWIPTDGDGANVFGEIPSGTLSTDIYQGELEAENTITKIDGVGAAQIGGEAKRGSVSATRDAITDQYLRLRNSDNQEIWEEFLESAYQAVKILVQRHMKGAIVLQVTGMAPIRVSREVVQGEMEAMLSFGSTLPRDREREKAEAQGVWTMFANNPNINQVELIRYVLRKQGDVRDLNRWLSPAAMTQAAPVAAPSIPSVLTAQMDRAAQLGVGAAGVQAAGRTTQQEGSSPLEAAASFRKQARADV